MNKWMKPIVSELQQLYEGVDMTVLLPVHLQGSGNNTRRVQALLILVSCDAPGLRRILGFAGHTSASHFCSKCVRVTSAISQFSLSEARARTAEEHRHHGNIWLHQASVTSRDLYAKTHGYRYSPFSELQYFDCIRFHVIDAMHSLLLGSCKHLLMTMTDHGMFCTADFARMQKLTDQVRCPREVGAVPRKIESHMAFLKADQVLNMLITYVALKLHFH